MKSTYSFFSTLQHSTALVVTLALLVTTIVAPAAAQTKPAKSAKSYAQAGLASLAEIAPVLACDKLAGGALNDQLAAVVGAKTEILNAKAIHQDGATYCEISTLIAPNIHSQYRFPVKGWTQRYLQTGCGGLCGMVDIHTEHDQGCVPADTHALALGATDMGHSNKHMGDGSFGDDPQARIDFAYRGQHLTVVLGKELVRQFYGVPAKYNYFAGCSDGGREALMEAQRYPNDFNGISAGAPAMNFVIQNSFYHGWQATSNTDANGKTILTADKLPLLHKAVLDACDALDGQKDGIINDPRQCKFDPVVLQCKENQADTSQCLSAAQVETVRKLYAGPVDANGKHLTIGGPQYGSELSWDGVFVTKRADQVVPSTFMALGSIKKLIFEKNTPDDYTLKDFHFDAAQFDLERAMHSLYDATNPDLSSFANEGGKLILWHGWSDPHISPINTIAYYTAVNQVLGKDKTSDFAKLFLFPGMYHCAMGDGPSEFDLLTPLMRWTESNQAPTSIVAHTVSGFPPKLGPPPGDKDHAKGDLPPLPVMPINKAAIKTRIVFAYPNKAVYKGTGNPNDPANYRAQAGEQEPTSYDWYGAEFMQPGSQKQCSVVEGKLICQ